MRFGEVTGHVLTRFPELEPAFGELRDGLYDGEQPGEYIVVEDLLGVYIELLMLRGGERSEQKLADIFRFAEDLLAADDPDAQGVGMLGLLYGRGSAWLREAEPFLGPLARRYLDEYFDGWIDRANAATEELPPPVDAYGVASAIAD